MGSGEEPGTPGSPTFRAEALAHRARRQGPGALVQANPRWMPWAFYVLVSLFVLSLVGASLIEIDRYARGPVAPGPGGRVVVLLPAALAPEVERGSPVELGSVTTEVVEFEEEVLYPTEVRERFAIDVATPSVAVVTSTRDEAGGSARVLIESEPVIVALIPGLKALFGS